MKAKGYAHSVVGKRDNNQDSFLALNERQLYAVADGVGGGLKGDVASAIAISKVEEIATEPVHLKAAFLEGQRTILKEALDTVGSPIMGTTLVALMFDGEKLHLCHVGDSRCYRIEETGLRRLTEDHEFYDDSVRSHVLSSYLGIPEETYPLRIDEEILDVTPGSRFIICSDGLYRQLSEERILEIVRGETEDRATVPQILCEEAAQHEYSDNVTVVYIEID